MSDHNRYFIFTGKFCVGTRSDFVEAIRFTRECLAKAKHLGLDPARCRLSVLRPGPGGGEEGSKTWRLINNKTH